LSLPTDLINKRVYAADLASMQVKEGNVMMSYGVGVVLSSKADNYAEGQMVMGDLGWRDYAVVSAIKVYPIE
jgi:NADPH-dependent curcumin reductase CurA